MSDGILRFWGAGGPFTPWRDAYHYILRSSWPTLSLVLFAGYVAVNVFFACLYLAGGDCIGSEQPDSFLLAFSFSVQTISTIGYGAMSPTTPYAHIVVAVEVFCGLLGVGLATGIIFQKFARPTARVRFSNVAVVAPRNGVPTLMFRMVNERSSHIVDLRLTATVLVDETSSEGDFMRRFYNLELERDRSPVFALSFTAMHAITPTSPLYGIRPEEFADRIVFLVVTVTGIDDTIAQTVHSQWYYPSSMVKHGERFVDIMVTRNGRLTIEPQHLDATEPL